MGCGPSKQAQGSPQPRARPHTRPIALQRMEAQPHRGSDAARERTERPMTAKIRAEFLTAIGAAFENMEYGIIGGAALAEYGNTRDTSDVDIVIPHEISLVVEDQLLSHGMIRTTQGGLGYVASDNLCYGLDVTADRDINQRFQASRDTRRAGSNRARIAKIDYLLNTKGHAYLTRVGNDKQTKTVMDATDILFIIDYMRQHRIPAQQSECRWVTDHDFWTMFCESYEGAEQALQSLGLHCDPTPSSSNRDSRNTSMSIHSRNSSRNGGGRPQRH